MQGWGRPKDLGRWEVEEHMNHEKKVSQKGLRHTGVSMPWREHQAYCVTVTAGTDKGSAST